MPEQLRHNPELCRVIADRIATKNPHQITFAEYMDLVLYHPEHGYYATNAVKIGTEGDFFTAPHLGADFGEVLAEQFAEMWHRLGQPSPFTLIEMGAGQGLLANDILHYLHQQHPTCFQALQYIVIERAAALIEEQRFQLQHFVKQFPNKISWRSLDELPEASIVGCFFSNELVDALPVHLITRTKDTLQEIYVTSQPSPPTEPPTHFQEVTGELSTPRLAEYFSLNGVNLLSNNYPEGYQTEVNLAALDWLKTVAERLQHGYVLTIDYGYSATRYYNPMRSQGTLQCYYQHAHHNDPYINVGHQDLTAHVDFTALERYGEQVGLQTLGFTQQGLFLMALGLGDRIAALSTSPTSANSQSIQDILRRREALHLLMNPTGMGNFGVLIQGKGLTALEARQPLKGLKMPSM
jgi:SAM-dependent MidA family methyltransferase